MKITGPVAEDQSPPADPPRKGLIAGCLSGCTTLVGAIALTITTGLGAAYEVTQPAHKSTQSVPDGSCTFSWWRSATGGARYRIDCTAKKELTLTQFKLLSGPKGVELVESVEDWGQAPWEDQRPMSGETITVDAGRTWRYDGTISLGMLPYVGPEATVTLWAVVDKQKKEFRAVE